MPLFSTPLSETYLSVTRRVARSAIDALFKLTPLPREKVLVSFSGEAGQNLIWNSKLKHFSKLQSGIDQKLPSQGKFIVEIREETLDDRGMIMPTYQSEHAPLFQHDKYPFSIYPVYDFTKLTLSCTYRAENREEADIFRNDFRHHIANGRGQVPIEVVYLMLVPDFTLAALKNAWDCETECEGYGIDFLPWLQKHTGNHMKVITKLNGEGTAYAIQEKQVEVFGEFEFTTPPERQKQDKGSTHEVTFDFTLCYEKPIEMLTKMPLVIHNQMVHEMFHIRPQYDIQRHQMYKSHFRHISDAMMEYKQFKNLPNDNPFSCVCIPEFDDWEPRVRPDKTVTLATSLVQVNLEDKKEIMNLFDFEEIGAVTFSNNLKRFVKIFPDHLRDHRESPFFITVYENEKPLSKDVLIILKDGTIRCREDLNPRNNYHLCIQFLTDWTYLSDNAIKRLCALPWMTDEFLEVMYPEYNKIDWDLKKHMDLQYAHWRDPRWRAIGMELVPRLKGWNHRFMQEFWLKHGRYPTDDEIDDYFMHLSTTKQANFFGQLDEREFRRRFVNTDPFDTKDANTRLRIARHSSFITLQAYRLGEATNKGV